MALDAEDQLQEFFHRNDQGLWATAALILSLTGSGSEAMAQSALDVVRTLGLPVESTEDGRAQGWAAQGAAPVHQVAALLRGEGQLWADQSDEALIAQGMSGAQAGAMMAREGIQHLDGLSEAFATTGTRMLDVGTGVAAIAASYAQEFPRLTVVGIDVMPRVLALAEAHVAASGVGDRVLLRNQDVATLDEVETYAFAWMPAPFLSPDILSGGLPRVVDALVPGGWLMLGHGKFDGSPAEVAVNRFKTIAYGGTALTDEEAQARLRDAALERVMTIPTPPGVPALTFGRKSLGS